MQLITNSQIPAKLLWPTRILIMAMLLLTFGLMIHPLGDPDVFIHLRDGRHWVENNLHVDKEPFAYTVPGKSIERMEVLFRIGLYLTYKVGGYSLLTLVKAVAMTISVFLLGLLVYRRWPHLGVVGFLLAIAIVAPMNRIMPERPYVITYLLLPMVMLLIDIYRRTDAKQERSIRKYLWFIPLVTIPWANLHPGFIVMFGFLGAQILDDSIAFWRTQDIFFRQRAIWLSIIFALSFVAGAVNPVGFHMYTFVLETTASDDFMKYLTEWAPPVFSREPLFFILLISVWLAQLFALRKTRLFDLIPMLAFSYLAVKSYRNMPLFFFAALPPFADHLQYLWQKYFPKISFSQNFRRYSLYAGSAFIGLLLIFTTSTGYAFRLGEIPGMFPKNGLQWLMEHPIKGRLLTHDIWGGYTGWATRGQIQVFIDGRFPLFGEKLYAEYRKIIWGDPQQCLALLDKHNIQGLLISPKNEIKLFYQLWKSRNWALVYWDDVCSLYVRKTEAHKSLTVPFQYFAIDPKRNPYFNPAVPEMALQEAQRAAEISPNSFLPWFFVGELHLQLKQPEKAKRAFAEVLKRAPKHIASMYNLGVIALQEKRLETAENYFLASLKLYSSDKQMARTYYMLAITLKENPKRRREARSWAKRALKLLPSWKEAQALVNELQ
jgi:tetratricopeptide (TPR) repeat protein